jgi:hypothetical protein
MKTKSLSLEQRADFFRKRLAKLITYDECLKLYNLNPDQYLFHVRKRINYLIEYGSNAKIVNDAIAFDENRLKRTGLERDNQYCRLFDTSPEQVKKIHECRKKGEKFPAGFLNSVYNCEELFKIMLDEKKQGFDSADRNAQVGMLDEILKEKGKTKKAFFHNTELKSILENGPLGKKSFCEMIKHMDKVYQKIKEQPSWFDLTSPVHVHPWLLSEKNQWVGPEKVYSALKHILEEKFPTFYEASREEQISIIENEILDYTPIRKVNTRQHKGQQWFEDNQLSGILGLKEFKGDVIKILRDFDKKYCVERIQPSWFDSSQQLVLRWWKHSYKWMKDETQSYEVLKIVLEKNIEGFAGSSRSDQLKLIREKVCNYSSKKNCGAMKWFKEQGLENFILSQTFKPSGLIGTLRWFDKLYSKEREQPDWFNESEAPHLASKSNRFKRAQLVVVGYD